MLERLARTLLPEKYRIYLSWHRHRFGAASTLSCALGLVARGGRLAYAPNPLAGGGIFVRPHSADQDVFDEVFFQKEYDVDVGDPSVIIDAGAHIGLASIYFALRHPRARIIALEPEPSNYELLVRNTRAWPAIHPVKAGLWSHTTRIRIDNPQDRSWSFRVTEAASGGTIDALGVDDVMRMFGLTHVDLLKVDVEGSEQEVFGAARAWIDRVSTIMVEVHDRFRPGCTAAVERALAGKDFARGMSGESLVFTRRHDIALRRPSLHTAL